jgi:hypothetical protein
MAKHDVDKGRVRISSLPPSESSLMRVDSVYVVVAQAFCPNGHNLVSDDNEKFDGYPGIKIRLEAEGEVGEVVLSPFHGDDSKRGRTDWPIGTRFVLKCPVCEVVLPKLARCRCEHNGDLIKLYLTPKITDSNLVAVCNIWGCRRSRTIDNWQIISEYLDGQISD